MTDPLLSEITPWLLAKSTIRDCGCYFAGASLGLLFLAASQRGASRLLELPRPFRRTCVNHHRRAAEMSLTLRTSGGSQGLTSPFRGYDILGRPPFPITSTSAPSNCFWLCYGIRRRAFGFEFRHRLLRCALTLNENRPGLLFRGIFGIRKDELPDQVLSLGQVPGLVAEDLAFKLQWQCLGAGFGVRSFEV